MDEDDETRIVERAAPASEGDVEDDQTRVVERAAQAPTEDDEDDNTRVVSRATPADRDKGGDVDDDDNTRVVSHRAPGETDDDDDNTRVVSHRAPGETDDDDDNTRVVSRDAKKHSLTLPASGRRRGIAPPPAMEGFAPQVEEARGPGAVEAYPAREIPAPPPAPTPIEEGPEATRASAPSMPSVSRRSRLAARVAMSVFIASCVLAVAGVVIAAVVLL